LKGGYYSIDADERHVEHGIQELGEIWHRYRLLPVQPGRTPRVVDERPGPASQEKFRGERAAIVFAFGLENRDQPQGFEGYVKRSFDSIFDAKSAKYAKEEIRMEFSGRGYCQR
jgi:hypothetical protein